MAVVGVPKQHRFGRVRAGRLARWGAAVGLALGLVAAGGTTASAAAPAAPILITTPYPSVAAQAGSTISFDLTVQTTTTQQVDIEVTEAPEGWETTLRGGGFVIGAVTAGPDDDADLELEVRIPIDAAAADYPLEVRARGAAGTSEVALEISVQEEVNAGINITADFPSLRGAPGSTFTYTLTVENNTPAEQTFTFDTSGPQGWEVTASPSAQSQANTVTVEAGDDANVRVEAKPPQSADEGTYPINVAISSASGGRGAIELTAEVSGTPRLELTTADSRLNASGQADTTTRIPLIIGNGGSAGLDSVKLAGTAPEGWEVSFEPASIDQVRPNDTAQAVAVVKPKAGAVAGDYAITIRASAGSESDSIELRYSVEGSRALGVAGVGLIVAAAAVLGGVFWRFGRR